MATLRFKGKNIIWNHHLSVPYHTLDEDKKLSFNSVKADGSLIIEGDNLIAMKSLLPQYSGEIKFIYIDPPYNTGEEGWVYNDNVNSPLMKEWLGKEVGKDDLTRHDKWLCMMTPRLKLMLELLSEDGLLAVSLDDNELYNFRVLMDDILGESSFKNNVIVSRVKKNIRESDFVPSMNIDHGYVLIFGKTDKALVDVPLKRQEKKARWHGFDAPGVRKNMEYDLFGYKPPKGRHWMYTKDRADEMIKKGELCQNPRTGKPQYHLEASDYTQIGTNWVDLQEGSSKWKFSNGEKSVELIKRLLKLHPENDSAIVLDAFAGSGTTAQAVLELNEEDEGNRRFVMIQMTEESDKEPNKNICKDITRERVVRVIEKKLKKKEVGFEYRRVGHAIDAESILSGKLPSYKQLAKYVFYLATGRTPKDSDISEKNFIAGKIDGTEVYLLYKPDLEKLAELAITYEWAKKVSSRNNKRKIVYAPACFLDDETLEEYNMKFVSIPYNLFERQK
jgi:adenine-specific DNA-methyltransferase